MRYRLLIEVEYIIMLSKEKKIKEFAPLSKNQKYNLRKLYKNFTDLDAKKIKSIERKTKHDVKSVEYFLQSNLPKKHQPWVHFALTSEDVNNLSYSLMWKEAIIDVYLPSLLLVQKNIKSVEIGSYPFFKDGKIGVSLVLRSVNISNIKKCSNLIKKFIKKKNILFAEEKVV